MKQLILYIVIILIFVNCSGSESSEKRKYPNKDKSTSIYGYIKSDTLYNKIFSPDFKVIEIMSKNIAEGSVVNARIMFKKINSLPNETPDTSLWINNIIMSPENDIIKWGSIGERTELIIKPKGEIFYHSLQSTKNK